MFNPELFPEHEVEEPLAPWQVYLGFSSEVILDYTLYFKRLYTQRKKSVLYCLVLLSWLKMYTVFCMVALRAGEVQCIL